jgi:hypothetical protein
MARINFSSRDGDRNIRTSVRVECGRPAAA